MVADVTVPDDDVAGYHARNLTVGGGTRTDRVGATGRRRPCSRFVRRSRPICWLRRADAPSGTGRHAPRRSGRTGAWYEHPGDPGSPDNVHRHWMSHLTLALDIAALRLPPVSADADETSADLHPEPTPRGDDPEAVWTVTEHLIAATYGRSRRRRCGHCVRRARAPPPTGTVSPDQPTAWREFPIRDRRLACCRGRPCGWAGDGVHGARRALAWAGQGAAFCKFGLVVSTEFGGGPWFPDAAL